MTAYEETLHVNPEKNFEELNNEFAKVNYQRNWHIV